MEANRDMINDMIELKKTASNPKGIINKITAWYAKNKAINQISKTIPNCIMTYDFLSEMCELIRINPIFDARIAASAAISLDKKFSLRTLVFIENNLTITINLLRNKEIEIILKYEDPSKQDINKIKLEAIYKSDQSFKDLDNKFDKTTNEYVASSIALYLIKYIKEV